MAHPLRYPLVLGVVFVLIGAHLSAAEDPHHPVVPGFERLDHAAKADTVAGGQLLLTELNCASCHQAADPSLTRKQAPILDHVAGRVRISYLRKFLTDPQAVKPGTTMPNLFAGDPGRAAKIEALVHFLASTGAIRQEPPKLTAVILGRDLYAKVGCVASHGTRAATGQQDQVLPTSVPLGNLPAKYSIPSLAAFLANPHEVRPSGRMPRLLEAPEARAVATYLLQGINVDLSLAKGATTYSYYEGSWDQVPDFAKLKPQASGVCTAFDLAVAKRGDNFALRFEGYFKAEREGDYRFTMQSDDGSKLWIDGQTVVDNDGVHAPKFAAGSIRLKRGIHKVVVGFFQVGGGVELSVAVEIPGRGQHDLAGLVAVSRAALKKQQARPMKQKTDPDALDIQPALVAKGLSLFASTGCANCHTLTMNNKVVVSTLKPPALNRLKAESGCLAVTPARGLPMYPLSPAQRNSLAAALHSPGPLSKQPAAVIARTLLTFNCYACHVRAKKGGPDKEFNRLFQTTQPEMGDEARIPPPLDGVGAKLKTGYLRQVLDQGERDRPYMLTRMPAFGLANAAALADAFAATDKLPPVPAVHFQVPMARIKAGGRRMVGNLAYGCAKCHTFAGHKAEGVQGIDMTIMTRRLRRDWFHAYLFDPMKIRPGTRMPASWPDGKPVLPDILDGKAATQIEAIWVYLQDGANAPVPVGLNAASIPLTPDKTAIIYRNFIQGAGTRAIAVGYPEQVHLAFDANAMRLALLWQGAFIDAARHWTDRGSGFEGPLGDNVLALPSGVTFAFLDKPDTAWPGAAAKTLGYRFKGYLLNPDDRPTFRYALNGLAIEDFPNPITGKEPGLRRVLKLSSAKAVEHLYFRAAVAAKIEALGKGWYRVDSWKMKIESDAAPRIRSSGGKAELIVPVRFTNGKARLVQEFVW